MNGCDVAAATIALPVRQATRGRAQGTATVGSSEATLRNGS